MPVSSSDSTDFLIRLSWSGNPATKKNSQRIFFRKDTKPRPRKPSKCWPWVPFIFPSDIYRRALQSARIELKSQVRETGTVPAHTPVNVEAHYYLGARQTPDIDGLHNACADILEACQVIPNDYWISHWDGSKRLRDVKNPRTVVTITPAAAHIYDIDK